MPRQFFLTLTALMAVGGSLMAQPTFEVPKAIPPDADTLKQIEAKREELAKAIAALPADTTDDVKADVEVYAKAAEWIVRHGEWFDKNDGKRTLSVLDAGLTRAKAAAEGKTPWRDLRNKPVIRGYRSSVDDSVQPFSVLTPEGYARGEKKDWRCDIVLHGRDQTLTEVKFIAGKENAKPAAKVTGFIIEPYGRGNNAYRWAGEMDVFECFHTVSSELVRDTNDPNPVVLRGFSMGGAGTWHLGLHHPGAYSVIGPGAGFTTTRGYIKNLPERLPEYVEKCLHIYDAVDYAENAFNVPVVAYSGEKDPQKAAADNIEAVLKGFKEPYRFTHLVAPGLVHKMPPEWQAKADAEYLRFAETGREEAPNRVCFVTYTTRYPTCDWVKVFALDEHYKRSVIDARRGKDHFEVRTENISGFDLSHPGLSNGTPVQIDGQIVAADKNIDSLFSFEKIDGKWAKATRKIQRKTCEHAGPIDDAFMTQFTVFGPIQKGWFDVTGRYAKANEARFEAEWDKFLRGRVTHEDKYAGSSHSVLFGDPTSNPRIAEILPKLPITWTKEKLVVNGVEYDPKTHIPVLIYPNPEHPSRYVVINSGHTFHAADFQGSNALLYPRLGDWAVLKVNPTAKDPTAAEVVAGGLFDEFWQFPKK